MIFSHGLGGGRNSYSYVAGSLASHGIVVVCPEHRDGSAVISFIRQPNESGRYFSSSSRRVVPYNRISHDVSPEVHEAREAQLRIRLWEMGLIHDALLAMDSDRSFTNLNTSTPSLKQFVGQLDVQEPGRIIFGGHSFGATTTAQFLKSTYYADVPEVAAMERPLFVPKPDSSIRKQITEKTVTMLLDMWCFPLIAPNSAPLFNLPLPAYVWLAYGAAALILVLACGVAAVPLTAYGASAYLFALGLALGPQLLGHTAYNWSLKHVSPTFVAVVTLGEPVGSALLAWLFFGESFAPLQGAGFVLLLGGIYLAARGEGQ